MNISLDAYGGNRGGRLLLEFCCVTAANGILCGVEEIWPNQLISESWKATADREK